MQSSKLTQRHPGHITSIKPGAVQAALRRPTALSGSSVAGPRRHALFQGNNNDRLFPSMKPIASPEPAGATTQPRGHEVISPRPA